MKRNLFILTLMTIVFSSCLDENYVRVELAYTLDIFEFKFADNDSALIKAYFDKKGVPFTDLRFASESAYGCDTLCANKMKEYTSKLSVSELDSLELSDSCRFKYAAARYIYPTAQTYDRLYIGAFDYAKTRKE